MGGLMLNQTKESRQDYKGGFGCGVDCRAF